MSFARFTSHRNIASQRLAATSRRNLELAGMTLARECRDKTLAVSAGGNSKRARLVRQLGHRGVASGRIDPFTFEKYRHSHPGEPPRTITGFLRRNVKHQMEPGTRMVCKVGLFQNALYGYWLEVGVRGPDGSWWLEPRPWLVSTMTKQLPRLGRIAATGQDSPSA